MKQVNYRSHIPKSLLESYEIMQVSITIHVKSNIFKFLNKILTLNYLRQESKLGQGGSRSCKMLSIVWTSWMWMGWIIPIEETYIKDKDSSFRGKNKNSNICGSQETSKNKMTQNWNEETGMLLWVKILISNIKFKAWKYHTGQSGVFYW